MAGTIVDQSVIAAARDAFLSDGVESPHVRAETLRSWRRSLAAGAWMDARPPVIDCSDIDPESALLRAVGPVVTAMMRRLGTAEFAMVVTDSQARVVGRWASDRSTAALLDDMGTVVGASFDEAYVGSTGLGTVLEDRAISVVDGAEHFNRRFDKVIAVGAPIIHPGNGCVEGALDLVCPTGMPPETLAAVVESAARDAGERLLSGYAAQDRALLDAFLKLERRGPRRPVAALNGRIVMANTHAGVLLGTRPHDVLWRQVQTALSSGETVVELTSDTGAHIEADLRPIDDGDNTSGAVLQFGATRKPSSPYIGVDRGHDTALAAELLQRLPGRSALWRSTVHTAAQAAVRGGNVLLFGAPGCGTSVLASALVACTPKHLSGAATARTCVLLGDIDGDFVHDRIDDPAQHLTVATTHAPSVAGLDKRLLTQFEHVIAVPELIRRVEDVADIAPAILSGLDGDARLAPAALHALTQRPWQGNVGQLKRVVTAALSHATGSFIRPEDLPPVSGTNPPAGKLTYLQNVEREAIAALLASTDGNKRQVANILGISRATLYRKLATLHLD